MSLYSGHITDCKEKVLQVLILTDPFNGKHSYFSTVSASQPLHIWSLCILPGDDDMLFVWKENKHLCQWFYEGIKNVIIWQDGAKGWILSSHCVGE